VAEAASGLAMLVTAAIVGGAGAALYAFGRRAAAYYVPGWTVILIGIGPVYWAVLYAVKRRRGRTGLPVVEPRRPTSDRVAVLGILVALFLGALALAVILFRLQTPYHVLVIGPFGVLFGALWLVHGLRSRDWEDVGVGAALSVLSAAAFWRGALPPEVWLALASALFAVSGAVKHGRWRRWVRGRAAGASEAAAKEARP
jgi:hypothetical protein